jgi:hypothetical protein
MMYGPDIWIPLSQCQDGFLYSIQARNSHIGIYKESNQSFTISRTKIDRNYLFDEFHWDKYNSDSQSYGTVKPFRIIEKAPDFNNDGEKLQWLNDKGAIIPDERTWGFKT